MLKLEGVAKQYEYGKRLFGAVDMTVNDGEILSILGLVGAGKTTFLKTVAGLEEYEGRITLDGEEINGKTDKVIMVFDDGALFPTKTVFDNLAYSLKIRGVHKVEIAEKVVKVADALGLFACLKTRAKNLTLLEKRKVSIARILMREARLILLDDFLSDLPVQDADELFLEVSKICFDLAKHSGVTVIFATDNPRYAFGFGDRAMVLVDGDIKQIGTYKDMYDEPTTVWSAKAVDECYNTLKGTLSYENEKLTFTSTPLNSVFTLDENGKVVWEDKELYKIISLDVTARKDEIVEDYIGKDVLLGWHGDEFIFDENGLEIEVDFIKNLKGTIALQGDYDYETLSVVVDDTPDNRKMSLLKFLPKVKNVHFFTLSEDSIMKRKRQ